MHETLAAQLSMWARLKQAFNDNDGPQCWASICFGDACRVFDGPNSCNKFHMVRLYAVHDDYYEFIDNGRHYLTLKHCFYHAKPGQFTILWVCGGPNAVGTHCTGEELEFEWMHETDVDDASDDSYSDEDEQMQTSHDDSEED
jgi:uncharacterized protein (DUF1919 family)